MPRKQQHDVLFDKEYEINTTLENLAQGLLQFYLEH